MILRVAMLLIAMVIAAPIAELFRPTRMIAATRPSIDLEKAIPGQLGQGWHELSIVNHQVLNPIQVEALEHFYSQTITRVYVNRDGYQIMLSLAYGKEQTDSMRVHAPDVCYPAQGFSVSGVRSAAMSVAGSNLPVTRLVATRADRVEPVTYLIKIGDTAVASGSSRKIAQLRYGLRGEIPDGLLLRVSSIDPQAEQAFAMQERFLKVMAESMDESGIRLVFGIP
jgi:EpsI family protein